MAEITGGIEKYVLEMGRKVTGDGGHGLAFAVAGAKISHRKCAAVQFQCQMRTVATSKSVFLG